MGFDNDGQAVGGVVGIHEVKGVRGVVALLLGAVFLRVHGGGDESRHADNPEGVHVLANDGGHLVVGDGLVRPAACADRLVFLRVADALAYLDDSLKQVQRLGFCGHDFS